MIRQITTAEFDEKFDNGDDISDYIDWDSVTRPGQSIAVPCKPVNIDMPVWMINRLDSEAKRLNIPIDSVIKTWIAERLQ